MKYGHFTLLPEQAFIKVGGQIKPQGGGSSGASSAPSSQTVTSTSIPEYARPYAESMLGQTSALTNINNNPYQPYQGQQVAGFSPLQNQGFASLADMQVAPQIAMGTDIAKRASEGAMGTAPTALGYGAQGSLAGQVGQKIGTAGGLGYGSQAAGLAGANIGIGQQGMQAGMGYGQGAQNPNAVQGYMNPYLQAALQPQLQEMQRQYGISGAQGQSNATRAGAFGGSREALTFAENQRNKNIAMNQAIGQGYNTAYDVANRNMQAAAALGMQGAGVGLAGLSGANQNYATGLQGVNTALAGTAQGMQGAQTGLQGVSGAQNAYGLGIQGANTLGSLGTAQYNQQMGIAQAQLGAGAQQQQYAQQQLNIPYQQYQEQLNYPYKQLAFQSDMMRGLPLSQSAQTIYQNTGSMVPQVLGAGIAAYGASAGRGAKEGGLMSYARGGAVQGYAMGGQPVVDPRAMAATSPAALPSKLAQLSDGQLQAYARTVKDAVALAEVKAEMARRSNVRQPQGEEPTQTVAESIAGQGGIAEQPVMAAAGGGIVALASGSEKPVKDDSGSEDDLDRAFATSMSPPSERKPRSRPLSTFSVSDKELNEPSVTYTPTSEIKIPAPENAPNLSNWEAQQQEAAQNVTLNAERQAMAQEQQNRADTVAQMYAGNAQEGPGQYPNLGGITAVPRVAGAPVVAGAPAGGGIIPAGGAPAGGAPAGGINAITPRTAGAGGQGTTIGATGAGVPVGVPDDPLSFATYRANVEDMAKLDPQDKAVLANMQARTEKRLRRAEGQEKNVMNDAFVSAGLAMMGGLNLADGIKRAADAGGKQYFSSQAEARKAIDKAEDAQDAFDQYRTALKQGNKKLANEMYGTFYKSYADVYSKITAAGITAGASREATAENRAARLQMHATDTARREFEHSETIRVREAQIEQNAQHFKERMTQLGDTAKANDFDRLQGLKQQAITNAASVEQKIRESFQKDPRYYSLSMVPESQLKPAQLKERRIMEAELADRIAQATKPFNTEVNNVINRQSALMGLTSIQPNSGGARTYNRATGQLE